MESGSTKENRRWRRSSIYLGSVENGSKSEVEFRALEDIPTVKLIKSSCGCTKVKMLNDRLTSTLSHNKARHLPEQKFNRKIEVHYENGEMDEFSITGKIV